MPTSAVFRTIPSPTVYLGNRASWSAFKQSSAAYEGLINLVGRSAENAILIYPIIILSLSGTSFHYCRSLFQLSIIIILLEFRIAPTDYAVKILLI